MATKRRRKSNRRRSSAPRAANPRRRRRRSRRHNPVARRARRASAVNPRRRRRHARRRNPGAMRIGEVLKDMVYGAGGAIATRVISSVVTGFVPAALTGSKLTAPGIQAAVAVVPVRWLGKKFLGPKQGDMLMIGGLISAGLALADAYLPGVQDQLTGVLRAPLQFAQPVVVAPAGNTAVAGYRDVEEVPDSVFAGMRDVEDIPAGFWG